MWSKLLSRFIAGATVLLGGALTCNRNLFAPICEAFTALAQRVPPLHTPQKYPMEYFSFAPLSFASSEDLKPSSAPTNIAKPLPLYTSDPNSVAQQIAKANGNILPIDLEAFTLHGFMGIEFLGPGWTLSSDKIRAFYEQLGIKINGPYSDLPGWYRCTLPPRWRIDPPDVPNHSRDEATIFIDGKGRAQFCIISMKDARQTTTISLWTNQESLQDNIQAHRTLRQHRRDYIKTTDTQL